MKNKNLTNAKTAKNDEFYTQLSDIENELQHYTSHFKDKIVYCNCDNPEWSNFVKYFTDNYERLGLKGLLTNHYDKETGEGDFRSEAAIEKLKQCDIVVTNCPFSLFREYLAQLVEYDKQFLIIGNLNAVTYKDTFKLIKDNMVWLGITGRIQKYLTPDGSFVQLGNSSWFTNLKHNKTVKDLILTKSFDIEKYPMYDNYFAFNIDKVKEIPIEKEIELLISKEMCEDLLAKGVELEVLNESDAGNLVKFVPVWGVPITYLDKHNPMEFEIIDINPHFFEIVDKGFTKPKQLTLTGRKDPYARILIKPIK